MPLQSPPSHRTPVVLLTGFLGSGKTTLLNAILRDPAFADTAVIVNEFGAIGLDHHLIASASDNIVLLDSGCLCCTLGDSLQETLADLHRRRLLSEVPAFQRVVIETSGLADPAPILNTLLGYRLVTDVYQLNAVVCTFDAEHGPGQVAAHPEVRRQLAMADRVVLTKTDRVSQAQRARARESALSLNAHAEFFESRNGDSAAQAFTGLQSHDAYPRYFSVVDTPHRSGIAAHCFMLDSPVTWAGIAAWSRLLSEAFGSRLLRTKALLRVSEENAAVFLQGVQHVFHPPQRLAEWPDADPRGRIVCITQDINVDELRSTLSALTLATGADAKLTLADLRATHTTHQSRESRPSS